MTTDARQFRIRQGKKLFGPLSRGEVLDLLTQGRLYGSDLASDGGPWRPLAELLQQEPVASPPPEPAKTVPEPPKNTPSPHSQNNNAKVKASQAAHRPRRPMAATPAIPEALESPAPEPVVMRYPAKAASDPPAESRSFAVSLLALVVFACVFAVGSIGGALVIIGLTMGNGSPTVATAPAPAGPTEPVADRVEDKQDSAAQPRNSSESLPNEGRQTKPPAPAEAVPAADTQTAVTATKPDVARSVALLCLVEHPSLGNRIYLPIMTVWSVGPHHFAARAVRLLPASQYLGQQGFELHAVTSDRAYNVVRIHFHPDFPADQVGKKNPDTVLEKLFLNDVAVVEVDEEVQAPALPMADDPQLQTLTSTGGPMVYWTAKANAQMGEALSFRPAPKPMPLTPAEHLLAPRGDARFAGFKSENLQLYHDAAPVLNPQGQVIGLLSLTHGQSGLIKDGPHQILSVKRVRELLDSLP